MQKDLQNIIKKIKYDSNGGIINFPLRQTPPNLPSERGEVTGLPSREGIRESLPASRAGKEEKTSYNFLEKMLIRYSPKVNYLLDANGRYKCRDEKIPQVIRIGPTNRCTGQCFYCPREIIHKKGTGYMDFGLYERIIAWSKENGVKVISFAFFGEPLLHPRIFDMIDLAHKSGLGLRISTNGIILSENTAKKLLSYPFDSIELSMDGYTREEYARGKQVDMYEKTKKNILYLLDLAKKKKAGTVFNVHFVDIGHVSFINKIKYIRFWKKQLKGLNYATSFYYEPHNWAGTRSDLAGRLGFVDRLLGRFELKKPCVYLKGMNIDYNGDVYICTNDPTQKAVIGNMNIDSLYELYKCEARIKFLSASETGDFRGMNCEICTVNTVKPLLYIKKKVVEKIVGILG